MIPIFTGFIDRVSKGSRVAAALLRDGLYKVRLGMDKHVAPLRELGLPVPDANPRPTALGAEYGSVGYGIVPLRKTFA